MRRTFWVSPAGQAVSALLRAEKKFKHVHGYRGDAISKFSAVLRQKSLDGNEAVA